MSRLRSAIRASFALAATVGWPTKQCEGFVVRSSTAALDSRSRGIHASRVSMSRPCGMEMKSDRAGFVREGVLSLAGVAGLLGVSSPATAAGWFSKDVVELENVPARTMIGKTQSIALKDAAPAITAMRIEAREHFAKTEGAKGGREVTRFTNNTLDGADITVGIEVTDARGSPAISDGFTASVFSPPGEYLRDDHNGKPGTLPWLTFMAQLAKEGYAFEEPLSLFEVYSGQGGQETVSMYAAVKKPAA
ncbi:unnamed protein product [Scytosiphon promiscuus]